VAAHGVCGLKKYILENADGRKALLELGWEQPLAPFEALPARMYGGLLANTKQPEAWARPV
jgi:hypothetical protein